MKRLLIGKNLAYAKTDAGAANSALTPDLLASGSIGVYGFDPVSNKTVLITETATGTGLMPASTYKGKTIQIFQGIGNGKAIEGGIFDVKGIQSILANPYEAPNFGALYLGYNETSGNLVVTYDAELQQNQATVKIIEKNVGNNDRDYYHVTVPVTSTSTSNSVTAALVAKINELYGDMFTATQTNATTNYGIKLVPKQLRDYTLISQEAIEGNFQTKVGNYRGSGTPAIIADLEVESNIRRGQINKDLFDKKFVSNVDTSGTYNLYKLSVINTTNQAFLGPNPGMSENVESYYAFIDGAAQEDSWVAIMDILNPNIIEHPEAGV